MTINQYLTWYDHIGQLQSKIGKRLGVLGRIKHLLTVLWKDVNNDHPSLFLHCASILWGEKNNKILMNFIQVLQSKAAEIVLDRALDYIKQKTKAMLSFFLHDR